MSQLLVLATLHAVSTLTFGQFSSTDAGTFPPSMFPEHIPTRITMEGVTYVTMTSQVPVYMGYIANIGDSVTIACRVNSSEDQLEVQSLLDTESHTAAERKSLIADGERIVQVKDDKWLNTTITSLLMTDIGRYSCVDDFKQLVVINQYSPPKVVRHQCLSNDFNDLVCTFYTNCTRYDLVKWNVTWSTSSSRQCGDQRECQDIQCTPGDSENRLSVSYITAANKYQTMTCTIKGFLFVGVTYDFKIIGQIGKSNVTTVSNVSTPLDCSIVLLEPPQVVRSTTSAGSLKLRMKLNETHIVKVEGGSALSHIEQAIQTTGLRYRITYNDSDIKQVNTEIVYSAQSTVNVTGLQPYTRYNVSIAYQIADTINRDKWSEPRTISIKTEETTPWVPPDNSAVGFSLSKVNKCKGDKREVVIYWKAVPDKSGFSNGHITSYAISDLPTASITESNGLTKYHETELVKTVDGDETAARLCLDNTLHKLGIVAINSAGDGPVSYSDRQIVLPASQSVLELRECDFTVVADEQDSTIRIEWNERTEWEGSEFTVFLCKPGQEVGCMKDTLSWHTVPQNQTFYEMAYDSKYLTYQFGLARQTPDMISSGIIWTPCISQLSIDLVAAKLSVQVDSLTAHVEISDTCTSAHRLADRYTLSFCQFNIERHQCSELASTIDVSRCDSEAEVVLDKHNHYYAFWITSHSGSTMSSSTQTIKRTAAKELTTWEIGLIVVSTILLLIAVCVISVFIHKQHMKARAYKTAQIIAPAQLAIEEERSDTESDSTDRRSLIDGYLVFRPTPAAQETTNSVEMVPATNFDAATRLLDDDWLNSGGSSLNYHELGARPRQRAPTYKNQPAAEDYRNHPAPADDGQSCSYSKVTAPSQSSYRALPDDYLQCVGVEPEFNLSAGTYYDDSSSGINIIDINKYLPDTGAGYTPTNKLMVDLESQYPESPSGIEDHDNKLCVDLPEIHIPPQTDSHKGLQVDLPASSLPSHQTSGSQTNISPAYYPYTVLSGNKERPLSNEGVETSHSDSDSYKSRGNSFSSSPGGTSGDSGYDGRNHSTNSNSRNNSLPKTNTKSDCKISDIDDDGKDIDDSLNSQ